MKRSNFLLLVMCAVLLLSLSVPGVFAVWQYFNPPESVESPVSTVMGEFQYGLLYITKVEVTGGAYSAATVAKTDDVDISANITLNTDNSSSVVVEVTFYNSTDVSYYYNETQTVSFDNNKISYEVSGIVQKEEIPSKTYKTVTVTFSYAGSDVSNADLAAALHFNFVVDKDSIGTIVAQTAVDRFLDILNNKIDTNGDGTGDSYDYLENAMNNRSGWNQSSAVTYIGNVYGSSSSDSQKVEDLFGEEFMSMDLDGDGTPEPITMMIKRENLDGDNTTGDSYTYENWRGQATTVNGVEMTIYITSVDLSNVSSGAGVVVYAASFTKLPGADTWTELVPLTKGTASANNYNGYGDANSFNTDTWVSDGGKTMKELAAENAVNP